VFIRVHPLPAIALAQARRGGFLYPWSPLAPPEAGKPLSSFLFPIFRKEPLFQLLCVFAGCSKSNLKMIESRLNHQIS